MNKQMGRPKAKLELEAGEREELKRLARRRTVGAATAIRARIVLLCADGLENIDVAERLGLSNQTVGKWRNRFIESGFEGLLDEPRVGRPRTVTDEIVERIVDTTLHEDPKAATHWSSRMLAEQLGVTPNAVLRVWRAFGLRPDRTESFSLSKDPQFVEKVRDVVGLYMSPPDNAVVLCVDEKSQIQALERAQPVLPMSLGQPERQTHDYIRHGTTDLFAALDAATGEILGKCYTRHRAIEFKKFLVEIETALPREVDIHIVLDNLATHKTPAIKRWLAKRPRFHFHFTPTHASWLNLVERFFGLLTDHALRRGSHTSVPQLKKAIHTYLDAHNDDPKPFKWTKSADQILESIGRFAQRTLDAHGKSDFAY